MAEKISANRTVGPNEAKAALRKCIKKQRPVFILLNKLEMSKDVKLLTFD